MANLFLKLQHVALAGIVMCGERRHLIKANLEWDETGQSMQLRKGLVRVDGVMPVLVLCHYL